MTPGISDFIPGLLGETDKYIKVAYEHFVTAKQSGEVQIKMRDDNGKLFIATLYDVLLAPDLCDRLFIIIKLMNLVQNCLFHKGFARFYSVIKTERGDITAHRANKTCIFGKNEG